MDILCELPYRAVNIDKVGNVRSCCMSFCKNYSYGNIFQESFDNIWNSEKAKKFRKQFIDNDFKYCNLNLCLPYRSDDDSIALTEISDSLPCSVILEYEKVCNVRCIFCTWHKTNISHYKNFDNIEAWAPDVFKGAKQVNLATAGEIFASNHCKKLIKFLLKNYPDIKYDILTNGLLFTKESLEELGIIDKLNTVAISFHSLKKRNYDKLVKGSDHKKVMQNVLYAAELKKQNKITELKYRFVITSYNYKEMPDFAQFAKDNGANVDFLNCIKYDLDDKLYKKLNIINPNHPYYNDFIKVISNPILKEDFVSINQALFHLKPVNRFEKFLKNMFYKKI